MLQDCPECRHAVSDSAEVCPNCGYRLIGRENMVFCPTCKKDVLSVVNPHDTISRYCPSCNRPITALAGRKVFFTICAIVSVAIVTIGIVFSWKLSKRMEQFPKAGASGQMHSVGTP